MIHHIMLSYAMSKVRKRVAPIFTPCADLLLHLHSISPLVIPISKVTAPYRPDVTMPMTL